MADDHPVRNEPLNAKRYRNAEEGTQAVANDLPSIFPNANDLLALEPEELGGVLLELIPGVLQNEIFGVGDLAEPPFRLPVDGYPSHLQRPVYLAIAEAVGWLLSQGLILRDPFQSASWYRLSRRAGKIKTRADVEAFRKGRILPVELLPPILAEKVWSLFLRGDHDVAVFQAFKEVAVRKAANAKGAGFPDDLVGVKLMRDAFHPDRGPLRDADLVAAERQAEVELFAGAIGHAKNPPGHRDVDLPPQEAARLIVFAAHLLDITARR